MVFWLYPAEGLRSAAFRGVQATVSLASFVTSQNRRSKKTQSIAMSPAHSRMEVNDRAQKLADLEDKHEHHTLAKFTETKSALEAGIFFSKQRHWKKTENDTERMTFSTRHVVL